MIRNLIKKRSIKNAFDCINQLINARKEWFYSRTGLNVSSPLRTSEISLYINEKRLLITCLTDGGMIDWRIRAWEWTGEKLLLEVTGVKEKERTVIELIPRASARAIADLVSDSRRARCYRMTQLVCSVLRGARISKMSLSPGARRGQPGRDARIFLELRNESVAVTGSVAEGDAGGVDAFLSSALIWFLRARERTRKPCVKRLLLVAARDKIEALSHRIALLRDDLRNAIALFEIDAEWKALTPLCTADREELLSEAPRRLRPSASTELTESVTKIVSVAPDAIDVLRARNGETLRFHGLPFARVRRLMNRERIWFGIDGLNRRMLDDRTYSEWDKLVSDLLKYRHAETNNRGHALYRAAPEAWLESILRRDITRLDPGLRIAPIHTQFRTSPSTAGAARPVDLLALRHDGRLAVIELKVAEDRNHVLQGADYWLRVEAHRRCGNIDRARLFDDALIANEPPLVYLVAPMLSFHRAFYKLANAISPDIKVYRFDLNEDWRHGVRVMRRKLVNQRFISYDESGSI